jgi:hypothetical protein
MVSKQRGFQIKNRHGRLSHAWDVAEVHSTTQRASKVHASEGTIPNTEPHAQQQCPLRPTHPTNQTPNQPHNHNRTTAQPRNSSTAESAIESNHRVNRTTTQLINHTPTTAQPRTVECQRRISEQCRRRDVHRSAKWHRCWRRWSWWWRGISQRRWWLRLCGCEVYDGLRL